MRDAPENRLRRRAAIAYSDLLRRARPAAAAIGPSRRAVTDYLNEIDPTYVPRSPTRPDPPRPRSPK